MRNYIDHNPAEEGFVKMHRIGNIAVRLSTMGAKVTGNHPLKIYDHLENCGRGIYSVAQGRAAYLC